MNINVLLNIVGIGSAIGIIIKINMVIIIYIKKKISILLKKDIKIKEKENILIAGILKRRKNMKNIRAIKII